MGLGKYGYSPKLDFLWFQRDYALGAKSVYWVRRSDSTRIALDRDVTAIETANTVWVGVAVLPPSGCALLLLGAFVILQADIVIQRLFPRCLVERIQQIIERNKLKSTE
jgi:hypothetical protein